MEALFQRILEEDGLDSESASQCIKLIHENPMIMETLQEKNSGMILEWIDHVVGAPLSPVALDALGQVLHGARIGYPSLKLGKFLLQIVDKILETEALHCIQFLARSLHQGMGIRMFLQEQNSTKRCANVSHYN